MLPRPSVLLNIPKTGSSYTRRFFDSADLLAFRRRCGVARLSVPNRAGMQLARLLKRHAIAYGMTGNPSAHETPHGHPERPGRRGQCPILANTLAKLP